MNKFLDIPKSSQWTFQYYKNGSIWKYDYYGWIIYMYYTLFIDFLFAK